MTKPADAHVNYDIRHVTGQEFYDVINREMRDDPRWHFLTDYSIDEYNEMTHRVLAGQHAGFAINQSDIAIIFNSQKNARRNILRTLMPKAIALGGATLDCYGDALAERYGQYGFVTVARVPFKDDQASASWDYEKFGRPDIHVMARLGDCAMERLRVSRVPILGYEEALEYRRHIIESR